MSHNVFEFGSGWLKADFHFHASMPGSVKFVGPRLFWHSLKVFFLYCHRNTLSGHLQ